MLISKVVFRPTTDLVPHSKRDSVILNRSPNKLQRHLDLPGTASPGDRSKRRAADERAGAAE